MAKINHSLASDNVRLSIASCFQLVKGAKGIRFRDKAVFGIFRFIAG